MDGTTLTLTHAGGVVVRTDGVVPRYLLVSARRNPDEWVLPKGHIEPGETVEQTAAREVLEEAGVVARVSTRLDVLEFTNWKGLVRAQFFLMRFERDGESAEHRKCAWLSADKAIEALRLPDLRQLIVQARDHVVRDRFDQAP